MRRLFVFIFFAPILFFLMDATIVFAAPPSVPDVGGTIWIFQGNSTANFVQSTDPQAQNIMYEIDWDGNGTVDGTTGYFASGAIVNIGTTAPIAGLNIKARAKNTGGETSAWSGIYHVDTSNSCEWGQGSNPVGRVFGTARNGQPVDIMIALCYVTAAGYSYPLDFTTTSGAPSAWSHSTSGLYSIDSWVVRKPAGTGSFTLSMSQLDQYGNDTGLGPVPFLDFTTVPTISGSCGSSNGGNFSSAPTSNLCSSGSNSSVSGSGPWSWGCYGNYPQGVSCSANIITSYNCESGSFNPSLNIQTGNSSSVIGFMLSVATRVYHNVFGGACFYYSSGTGNLFIPTKTSAELNSFINHLPAGVTKANGNW